VNVRARLYAAALFTLAATSVSVPARAAGLDPRKAVTQYNLDAWTTASGLPQNTITAIAQTQDGYLWMGSFGGLARFDGARFVVFDKSTTPALRNSGVHALLADRRGGLWVGTNGGGLTFLKDGVARTFGVAEGLGADVVRSLFQDSEGRVWAGTNGGLSLLEGDRFRTWKADSGFTSNVVRAIREDREGALWIGTNGDGLFRMKDGRFTRYTRKDGLPSDLVFSLVVDKDGALWIGTNGGGLARYAAGKFRRYGPLDGLDADIIWSLLEDADGSLWVGTYGAGLFRREGDGFRGLTTRTGLSSDFVRALGQDSEGSLWIGTNTGGLARLRDGKFTTYTTREGLPSDIAKTVLAGADGTLWVGTSGGGLARLKDGAFETWSRREGLPHEFVQALMLDRRGGLWVGTNGAGVALFADGRFHTYSTRDGLVDDHVSALVEAPDGTVWIGTNSGGVSRFQDGRFTSFTRGDGLGANLVMAMLVDHEGAVWVGTDGGGLTRIGEGKARTFTVADGLAADSVLCLHQDREGTLWVGTSGGGLSHLEGGRFATVSTREGLHDDVVFAILEDAKGSLWLSGNRGLSRVDKSALRASASGQRVQPEVFGIADGMKSEECSGVSQPAATRLPDGRLVFPTTRGIVIVDPERLPRNEKPPRVQVEELIASKVAYTGEARELPPGAGDWEIRFTALSFLAPQRVRFKYRLAGFDEEWVDAGTRRSAFYTQVPPGRYAFEVHAANNDGVWSDTPARTTVTLRPRFHQTRAFQGMVAALLLLAGGLGYAAHVRGLNARRRELERLVQERTRDLTEQQRRAEEARAEAERQRENAERQKEIAQQATLVESELLQIAAHDLKNPLQVVIGHTEMAEASIREGRPTGEFVGHIRNAAERMLGILTRLLDASPMDAGKLSLRPDRLDLADVARIVVENNAAAAQRKGQELQVVLDGRLPVVGDAHRLVEVVENLVGNAIKYSPPSSRIVVAASRRDGRAVIDVSDSGPGLSDDDKRRMFGRFQRLSATPTGGESSTGLGLSIAKQLAELMGGVVTASSPGPGQGACFTVSMPLAPD
jgi:ligand-binding sensor domain-containing protein/signal transduction histidine kinase